MATVRSGNRSILLGRDGHTTSDSDRGNWTSVRAEDIVDELNLAMSWQDYPGRESQTANAEEVVFAWRRSLARAGAKAPSRSR